MNGKSLNPQTCSFLVRLFILDGLVQQSQTEPGLGFTCDLQTFSTVGTQYMSNASQLEVGSVLDHCDQDHVFMNSAVPRTCLYHDGA